MTEVYIDEEYGYRYWKATVNMTEPQTNGCTHAL